MDCSPKYSLNQLADVHESQAAASLPRNGSIFCWVMTSKQYHRTRAMAINDTWIHRCDHGQLFTNERMHDENIPYSTVFTNLVDDYHNLLMKTRIAFYYSYVFVSKHFDWYLKADDDTYIIVENLRSYLKRFDPSKPHFIGLRFKPYLQNGYNAGGAGYVLSRGTLEMFLNSRDWFTCGESRYEDVGIAECLSSVKIYPEDTRDGHGRQRFNTGRPDEVFYGRFHSNDKFNEWLKDDNVLTGFEAFGPETISFHHLSPEEMRFTDVLLYRVRTPSKAPNS